MSLISLAAASKTLGSWTVFEGLDFEVVDGARVGIVGPNGTGKTTILRILAGLETVDAGHVVRRGGVTTAYLAQHVEGDDRSPVQTVLAARPDVADLDAALKACEAELARPEVIASLPRMQRVLSRQEGLLARWVEAGGSGLEGEVRRLLLDLGLGEGDLDVPSNVLSGGQRKLMGLASCLIAQPDVLLLDEPETHLDPDKRDRLEEVVRGFDGAAVTVSHDRYLLDGTVTSIAELDDERLTLWPGDYSTFAVAKELALQRQQVLYVTQQKEIDRLEEAIRRFRHWGAIAGEEKFFKKARQKQRQIDRMDRIRRPVFERRTVALEMRSAFRGGQKVLQLKGVTAAFDDDPVLLDVDLAVYRGERVGVIGPNGAGKSVLGRILAGLLEPVAGERWVGPAIRVGYLPQGADIQPEDLSAMDFVRRARPMFEDEAVNELARFLFRYDQMRQPVGTLSGGERTRLQFLLLQLSGANCLVLDEPTNHLDIGSMEVLEGALERYDGTAIVISHDRYFLDRIPDRIVEVEEGVVRAFDGGYSDRLEARMRERHVSNV